MAEMWFGNRRYMQGIPCPQVGADYGREGYSSGASFQNGGAFHRRSLNAAKSYNLSWALTSRDAIRTITDFADGVYGPGPYYWVDPFAADKNVLAQSWATPSLGGYDGPILNGRNVRPDLVATSPNTLGYPAQSAVYEMTTAEGFGLAHWVPIPPGYRAWVGVHGTTNGVTVEVRPTTGFDTYAATDVPTMLPVTSTTRVNRSYGSASYTGIELTLSGDGSCVLSGIIVQILPEGIAPETGGFISGQGHSGAEFTEHPTVEAYSAALDLVGCSANLIEVEQWQ